jgi:hypothetical protein
MNERLFYVFASVLILASADSAVAQNDVPASVAEVQTAVEKGLFFGSPRNRVRG